MGELREGLNPPSEKVVEPHRKKKSKTKKPTQATGTQRPLRPNELETNKPFVLTAGWNERSDEERKNGEALLRQLCQEKVAEMKKIDADLRIRMGNEGKAYMLAVKRKWVLDPKHLNWKKAEGAKINPNEEAVEREVPELAQNEELEIGEIREEGGARETGEIRINEQAPTEVIRGEDEELETEETWYEVTMDEAREEELEPEEIRREKESIVGKGEEAKRQLRHQTKERESWMNRAVKIQMEWRI